MEQHQRPSDKLPPHIDPAASSIAYGDRALPKIVSVLFAALFPGQEFLTHRIWNFKDLTW